MNIIHSVINHSRTPHSRESGKAEKHWIPGQARNDKLHNTCIAIYRNQSGAALVIALAMMIVLTLVGLASIFTSTFEIKISGNKRGSTGAFYRSDSGVQATLANLENFNLTRFGSNNKYENVLNNTSYGNTNPTNAYVILYHDTSQSGAPRGSGMSATHVDFIHFIITSTAQDQMDLSPIKSTCTIDQKVVRLIPAAE